MASVKTSGSKTLAATGTAEDLATVTDEGQYQLVVDANALVDGDTLTLSIYGKARSSDTERLQYEAKFANAQSVPLLTSVAVVSPHSTRYELNQTGAAARAFPWAVYEID